MKDKEKNKTKKPRRRDRRTLSPDQQSDQLTASDIVVRLEQVQEDLADLLYEFRYLKRFSELEDVAYVTWRLDVLRGKCEGFAENGLWEAKE